MTTANCNPVHAMMSQGVNVVLAKTLLNIERNQSQAIAAIDAAWDEKLRRVKLEYDEKIERQSNEIQSLHVELRQLKEMFSGNSEREVQNVVLEQPDSSFNVLELKESMQEVYDKLRGLEKVASAVQNFMDDFVKRYECRNGIVDAVITKHENDFKTSRDTMDSVSDQVSLYSLELSAMESKLLKYINLLPRKFEDYVDGLKVSNESFVSVDEHNQLRINLEDQILECDMKCEHVLLTVQQQWEEYKRRTDEVDVVKGVLTRAKKRREFALASIQSKYHVLAETINNESKTGEVYDDIVEADPQTKICSIHRDPRKVHFRDEIDEPSSDGIDENIRCTLQYEVEDNESEFGNSVNLILLEEHSIH